MGSRLFARIVVGYDGSDHSKRALKIAIDLAKKYGSEVLVVTVVDYSALSSDQAAIRIAGEAANQISAEASESLSRENVPHRTYVRQGDPSAEITRVAEENDADLIVVGIGALNAQEDYS